MAVRNVTTLNKGKNTAGIDGKIITNPGQKLRLAQSLKLDGLALPIRRVWIPKPGKKEERPLGIPVIRDRAKQALAKLALEPEWEAIFEPNSYGFRPGRSAHDAVEAIFLGLHHNTPKWVFDADIRKCFDEIDHEALVDKTGTFPLMKRQIIAWLKAGVMEGYANTSKTTQVYPTNKGTPQGGIISPLLANIALHGLEYHLSDFVANLPIKPHEGANRGSVAKRKALTVVRYADDFVLIHRNKEILDLCVEETRKWLKPVGLEISEEKSAMRDGRNGLLFLGFQFIQVKKVKVGKYKVKIQPSSKSQTKLLLNIREIVTNNRSVSSYGLIEMIRPIIIGWANYFKYCECKAIFSKLTHLIFQKIRAWVFRRDTRNGRLVIKEKYFPSGRTYTHDGSPHEDNWILVGRQKSKKGVIKENFLPHIVWVKSRKHVKVLGNESPFSRNMYWAIRSEKHSPYPLRVRTLLVRQEQSCPLCKRTFTEFDSTSWEVDHILPKSQGGKDEYKNLQLLHKECHLQKTRKDLAL
jgi:RNA-directed DNA polymerase